MSDLDDKIKKLESVNRRRKALEAEEKELKQFFKDEADGEDAVFESGKISVRCFWKQRSGGWDNTKLKEFLGAKTAKYQKPPTDYMEVAISKA